jgi:hypothetical protein
VGTGDIAVTEQPPLQIAELVETEQRMITGAAEVTVVGRAFLLAVGLANRTIHVEDDLRHGLAPMDAINPNAREVHQRLKIVRLSQDLRLEQAHLAC